MSMDGLSVKQQLVQDIQLWRERHNRTIPSTLADEQRWSAIIHDTTQPKTEQAYAVDCLVYTNLPFILFWVEGLAQPRDANYSDLLSLALLGAVRAAWRYDPTKTAADRAPARFVTYAAWWMRQAVRDRATDMKGMVIPPPLRAQLQAYHQLVEATYAETGREPTLAELQQHLAIAPDRLMLLIELQRSSISLNDPTSPNDPTPLEATIPAPQMMEPDENVAAEETATRALAALTARERRIWQVALGMLDEQTRSDEETAIQFGVVRQHIAELRASSLQIMRAVLAPLIRQERGG